MPISLLGKICDPDFGDEGGGQVGAPACVKRSEDNL